ncbi:MAG: hypothetical protein IJ570_03265 [Prevotella sp.]|nr:hypothetical protein [Prevotella sp.]
MRKELVYSLLAVGGAFPITISAATVNATVEPSADLKGDVAVSTGLPLESSVNLVPGKYTLSIHNNGTNAITVKVADGEAVNVAAAATGNIPFEVKAEGAVTVVVSQPDGNAFYFDSVNITLNFDFAAAVEELEKNYNEVLAAINGYSNSSKDDDALSINKNVGQKISAIKEADATTGYELYVSNKLYDPTALDGIQGVLDNLKSGALTHEADYLQGLVDEQKALYDELSENAQAYVNDQDVNLETLAADIEAFKAGTKLSANVVKDIEALKASVKKGQEMDGDSNTAYQEVLDAVNAAQTTYNETMVSVLKLLPTEDETYGDLWSTLRSDAQKELTGQLTALTTVKRNNETSKKKGSCAEDKADYLTEIGEIKTAIEQVLTDYKAYKKTVTDELEKIQTLRDKLDAITEEGALTDKDVKKLYDEANTLVSGLENDVKAAASKEKVSTITDIDADEKTGYDAAEEAVDNITASDAYVNYSAYKGMLDKYEELLAQFDKAYTDGVEATSEDYMKSKWQGWYNQWRTSKFENTYKKTIEDQYKAKTAKTYLDESFKKSIVGDGSYDGSTAKSFIKELQEKPVATFKKINEIQEKIDGYQEALDEVTELVKDLDIYTKGTTVDGKEVGFYEDQIAAIQGKIDAIQKNVTEANKQSDNGQWEYTVRDEKVKDDTTIQPAIDALKDNYESDNEKYLKQVEEDAIEAVTSAIETLTKEIKEGLDEIKAAAEKGDYGISKEDILAEATAVSKRLTDDVKDITGHETDREFLDKQANTLYDIKNDLTKLQENAKAANDSYKANEAAKKAADKVTTAIDKALDDAQKAIETNDKDVKGLSEITDLKKEIDDAITAVKKDINDAYKAEELTADTYKEATDAINDLIKDYKSSADQAQKNYAAAADLLKLVQTVQDAINKAKTDAAAEDDGDAAAHWAEVIAGYQKTLDETKAAIQTLSEDGYIGSTVATAKSGYQDDLKALQTKVEAVKNDAKENLKQFTKQQEDIANAYTTYNDVFEFVTSNDETWGVTERQNKLLELYADLTDINSQIIEEYPEGKSKDNGLVAKIAEIVAKINDINAQVADPEKYNAEVTAQNKEQWEKVKAAYDAAQEAYNNAANTINDYEQVESELLKAALEAVKDNVDALNEELYKFPEDKLKKFNAASDKYSKTQSPSIFDQDGKLLAEAKKLQEDVEAAFKKFIDAIQAGVATDIDTTVKEYKDVRDNAAKTLGGWDAKQYDKKAQNALLADVDALIDDIDVARKDPKLAELDKALTAAENEETGVEATANKVLNDEAYSYLGSQLAEVEDNAEQWLETEDQEALAAERETFDADYQNFELVDNYADHKAEINRLLNAYKDAKANAQDYIDYTANLKNVQEYFDAEVDKYATRFAAYSALTAEGGAIQKIQAEIDRMVAALEIAHEEGTVNKLTGYTADELGQKFKSEKNGAWEFSKNIFPIYGATHNYLVEAEDDILDALYDDLQGEYVQYAVTASVEDAATVKEQIEALKKRLDTIEKASSFDKRKYVNETDGGELYQLENDFANLLTQLTTANNAEANTNALDKLNAAVAEAEAKANLDDYAVENFTEEEQADLKAQLEAINEQIEAVKAQVEDKADKIVAYEDVVESQIEAINEAIEALKATADKAKEALQKRIDAAKKLADETLEKLAQAKETIEAAQEEIDGYEFTSSADYQAKFNTLLSNLATAEDDINTKVEAGTLEDEDLDDAKDLLENTNDVILDVQNTAALRELNGQLDNLKKQAKEITFDEDDYTLGDYAKLQEKLEALVGNGLDEDDEDYKAGALADIEDAIAKAKKEQTTYTNLGSYDPDGEFVPGDIKKDIDKAQEAIDELKAAIEANKLEIVPGDISGDGKVGYDDVQAFLDKFLADETPGEDDPNFAIYDVNGDGQVGIGDAQAIMNIYLGLNADGTEKTAARQQTKLSASFDVAATTLDNGKTRLTLILNSDAEFTGLQMDVMGANVLAENAENIELRSNDLSNGTHRIISFGKKLANGTVITLDVDGDVQFANVALTTAQAQTVNVAISTATGISNLTADQQQTESFDLSGRVVNGWQKGVNIVRDAMGNVKKVFKK